MNSNQKVDHDPHSKICQIQGNPPFAFLTFICTVPVWYAMKRHPCTGNYVKILSLRLPKPVEYVANFCRFRNHNLYFEICFSTSPCSLCDREFTNKGVHARYHIHLKC